MGNGVVSKLEGAELMKQLKTEYEKLSELGYGDEIIKEKLEAQYTVFMQTARGRDYPPKERSKVQAPKVEAVSPPLKTPVDQTNNKVEKSSGSRRRSFEGSSNQNPKVEMNSSKSVAALTLAEATEQMGKSASVAPLPTISSSDKEVMKSTNDHWDSVSQMPYCTTCKMAFKSEGLLHRHVKYSELHKKTVAALDELNTPQNNSGEGDINVRTSTPEVTRRQRASQKEGEDFKLLYYGSKFYWRTQDNIDLSFFHHILCDTIEVVPYDVYKNRPLARLYLDMATCKKLVLSKENVKKDNKTSIMRDESRKALTTAILARLHLHDVVPVSDGAQSEPNRMIKFLPAATDDKGLNPLLKAAPAALIPRSVTHRRNTSAEEVTAKLHDLKRDQAALSKATEKAEKVVNVINTFAKDLKSKSKALAAMSLPKRRWVMAIRRVLQINGVAKTTLILEALAKKQASKSPGTKRRERAKALA